MCSGSSPNATIASRIETPSRSRAFEHALVERAGDGAAAEQRRGEAHALLVGEADDLDRERQPPPRRFSSATQAIAVITPSGPSQRPASRTVS